MGCVNEWLSDLEAYSNTKTFLAALGAIEPLPGHTNDPNALFGELLANIEWQLLATRRWARYFVDASLSTSFAASPQTAVVSLLDDVSGVMTISASLAFQLGEAYLRLGRERAGRFCVKTAYALGDRSARAIEVCFNCALEENRADCASELADEMAARYPDNPLAIYMAAIILSYGNKNAEAVSLLAGLLTKTPDFVPAKELLIELLIKLRAFNEALEILEAAPDSAGKYSKISLCHLNLGNAKAAKDDLAKALAFTPPKTPQALELALDGAKLSLTLGDAKTAQWFLKAALGAPLNEQSAVRLARLLTMAGEGDTAVEILQRQLAANPRSANLLECLGLVYDELKRDQEALECLMQAVELRPQSPDAILAMASICFRNQKLDTALELAHAVAASQSAKAPFAWLLIADILASAGEMEASNEALAQGMMLAVGNEPLMRELEKRLAPTKK